MPPRRPILVVLTGPGGLDPPAQLDRIADRVTLRCTGSEGLGQALQGAQALLLWDFFSEALREAWGGAGDLRWVHVAAAGVDTLLFDGLRDSDVVVTNARGVFDRPIAEFVLASVLAHAKRLHESRDLQRHRSWTHRETRSVAGARVLVLGTGGIGRATARLLRAVGMQVRGVGRTARADDPDLGTVVASHALADHVGWCDYLIVAAPLTPATRGLVDAEVLGRMHPGAHLVNVGRGATVVEADLVAALRAGRIDGATLDVVSTEPLPADSPLWDLPGLVLSPHMSGDVVGWRDALADGFVDNAERWLAGAPLANVVDKRAGYVPGA